MGVAASELYDNRPFAELCERRVAQGETWSHLAIFCGWKNPQYGGDTSKIKRKLGLLEIRNKRINGGLPFRQKQISYDVALLIVKACNADPVDFGL